MKINSPFRILVFFISVLTFSTPFVTIAQQNSVMLEAGSNAAQNANIVATAAKIAAEQDVSSDTNKIFWFGAGFAAFAIGCPIGGCVGCGVGSIVDPSYFYDTPGQRMGSIIGLTTGVLIPIIRIYNHLPHPPPERLIGKSPEYIEFYTDAYKSKTRSLRTKLAAAGAVTGCTGCGLMTLGCLVSTDW